ncbi:MAG: adenylate cyclase [Clostridia bacterium]|nr:adenylate cyclase [Clostridia bacterium]
MPKENIKALCLRFDLTDEDEHKAYDYLQDRDKAEFGSYTKLVSRTVNEFFERRLRIKDDPYFETREKEDAFIARVLDAVQHSAPSLPASQEVKAEEDENVEAMFAFLDDFG